MRKKSGYFQNQKKKCQPQHDVDMPQACPLREEEMVILL
jgi:hypothetical protein